MSNESEESKSESSKGKRKLSPEGRKKIKDAAMARWAKQSQLRGSKPPKPKKDL